MTTDWWLSGVLRIPRCKVHRHSFQFPSCLCNSHDSSGCIGSQSEQTEKQHSTIGAGLRDIRSTAIWQDESAWDLQTFSPWANSGGATFLKLGWPCGVKGQCVCEWVAGGIYTPQIPLTTGRIWSYWIRRQSVWGHLARSSTSNYHPGRIRFEGWHSECPIRFQGYPVPSRTHLWLRLCEPLEAAAEEIVSCFLTGASTSTRRRSRDGADCWLWSGDLTDHCGHRPSQFHQ